MAERKQVTIQIDPEKIKKKYDEHTSRCRKIAKEVEKWGTKTKPNLNFLKARPCRRYDDAAHLPAHHQRAQACSGRCIQRPHAERKIKKSLPAR